MSFKLFKHTFYKKKKETFKTGTLDIIVIFVVFFVFIYAFFFMSYKPLLDTEGNIVRSEKYWQESGGTDDRIPTVNYFAIIGPLIFVYEAFLLTLEGKKRGRYLPWNLYYQLFKYSVKLKIQEGKNQTREWLDNRK